MANLSPQELAEKYARRTAASTQDMIKGVQNVTVNPMQQAVAKQDKMLANLTQAVQSGKWARGMGRISLEGWKTSMIEKGAARVNAGVNAAIPKMVDFFAELLPYQANLKSQLDRMSDLSLEDSIARMNAWTRGMAGFKRRG